MRFAGDAFKFIKDNPFTVGGGLMGLGALSGSSQPSNSSFPSFGGFGRSNPGYSDNDSGWQHLGKMFLGPGLGGLIGKDFT